MIARYITLDDVEEYMRWGWSCEFLKRIRGDDVWCFLATFRCVQSQQVT